MDYTLDGILAWLDGHTAEATALRERLAGADLKRLSEAVTAREADLAKAKTDLTAAQATLDGYTLKETLAKKREKALTTIREHELGKRYGHLPETASDTFVQSLVAIEEAGWKGQLDDRLALIVEGLKPPAQVVRSAAKGDTSVSQESVLPEDRHARMRAAFGG